MRIATGRSGLRHLDLDGPRWLLLGNRRKEEEHADEDDEDDDQDCNPGHDFP